MTTMAGFHALSSGSTSCESLIGGRTCSSDSSFEQLATSSFETLQLMASTLVVARAAASLRVITQIGSKAQPRK